jgi:hypothetical protein
MSTTIPAPAPIKPINNVFSSMISQSANKINRLYDSLSYMDLYGSSVVLVLIVSLFVFLVCSYCAMMLNAEKIKKDWVNQRCNPKVIPFAGIINAPEGESVLSYTRDNFTYCVHHVIKSFADISLNPITSLVNSLTSLFLNFAKSMNEMRNMMSRLRTNIANIAKMIFDRILSVLAPLQVVFIAVSDTFRKIEGVLTAGLYTALSAYYTLQALMGAMVEMIIKILLIMLGVIIALWLTPVTWGAAAATSATFLAISIPLAVIAALMSKMMNIQTSTIPKLKCFDENVELKMADGSAKAISQIALGDVLEDGSTVVSKMRLNAANVQMYNLHGIIVSGTHVVKHQGKWIKIAVHPNATKVPYEKPYIYCLNTTSKRFIINGITFTDWDEIYEDSLNNILSLEIKNERIGLDIKIEKEENIHKHLETGFRENTPIELENGKSVCICQVNVGDKLKNGDEVYGIVEVDVLGMNQIYRRRLGDLQYIYGGINLCFGVEPDLTHKITIERYNDNVTKLYHLLTNSGKVSVRNVEFYDYNSGVDLFLQ